MVVADEVVRGGVTVAVNVVIAGSMVLQWGSHRCAELCNICLNMLIAMHTIEVTIFNLVCYLRSCPLL